MEIKDATEETKPMSINTLQPTVLLLGPTIHTLDNKELVNITLTKMPSKTETTKSLHKTVLLNSWPLLPNNPYQLPLMLHLNNSNSTQVESSMIPLIVEPN